MAPSKKPPGADDIMPVAAVKMLLKQVRKDGEKELSCVVAMTGGEDAEGVILLDKKMKPKKLRTQLLKDAKDAGLKIDEKSIRFGKATTDDADEDRLLIKVNKEPAGAALPRAVTKRVKGVFKEVIFSVDEALESESEESESQEPQPVGTAPPPPPPPGPPPSAKPVDVAALSQRLAELIKRIPGADPNRQAELGGLAKQANTLLKTGSPTEAAARMDELETKLGQGAPASGSTATAGAAPAALQKSRMAWDAARKKIVSEVEALKTAVAAAFQADEHEAEVTKALGQLDDIPKNLDTRLLDVLDGVMKEQDPNKRAELTQEAQKILAAYQQFVTSSPVLPKLTGATPFGLTLTVAPVANATLQALQAGLR
ncbi:MAG TPA: hypothetical protein VJY39_21025 [Acidisphaera sp.]|nr:hypothetical protein [Acidisphaera sp.]